MDEDDFPPGGAAGGVVAKFRRDQDPRNDTDTEMVARLRSAITIPLRMLGRAKTEQEIKDAREICAAFILDFHQWLHPKGCQCWKEAPHG